MLANLGGRMTKFEDNLVSCKICNRLIFKQDARIKAQIQKRLTTTDLIPYHLEEVEYIHHTYYCKNHKPKGD